MHIEILGADSLGVRSLSCVVRVNDRKIVIDPGLALGYQRHGLLPHPAQVAVGEQVRRRIVVELKDATDVVMSHFHGDHVPLPNANPYQLRAQWVAPLCQTTRFWAKGPAGLSHNMARRREALREVLGRDLPNAEGQRDGPLVFSPPVPQISWGVPVACSRPGASSCTRRCRYPTNGTRPTLTATRILAAIGIMCLWRM